MFKTEQKRICENVRKIITLYDEASVTENCENFSYNIRDCPLSIDFGFYTLNTSLFMSVSIRLI